MFYQTRNLLVAATFRKFLNRRFRRYGSLRELRLQPSRNIMEFVCDLAGEKEPVRICVDRYELTALETGNYLIVHQCSSDRPWITHLLQDTVAGRRFEIPGWARAAL